MTSKGTVTEIDTGWNEFRRRVFDFDGSRLEVGIFGQQHAREMIAAAVNEFGTDTIPERRAWRDTLDSNASRYMDLLAGGAELYHAGKITKNHLLSQIGDAIVDDLHDAINNWSQPANAPATVRSKKRNDPLVDTGATHDAIEHRVIEL